MVWGFCPGEGFPETSNVDFNGSGVIFAFFMQLV